jgi:DNA polymerase-4/protein ImuB
MKTLCVLLPHFPLRCEIQKHPEFENCPIIITYNAGSQKLVLDYSPRLEGLQPSMPLQQALSLHDEARLIQADISHYQSIFNKILDLLEEKSPLVEASDTGKAYLGIDGMQMIYPDEASLAQDIIKSIPEPFKVQVGISSGKFPAYLAALRCLHQTDYQILTGDIKTFLKDLPCEVLPISMKSKNKLHSFGIHTLGQIAILAPGPLQAQFGSEGKIIGDLARGYDDTPLHPRSMEEPIEESTVLSSITVSLEAIMIAIEAMLSKILALDRLKNRGIRSLILWTQGWNSGHWEHIIQFKEPAMDKRNTLSRIKHFLENYPQPGPVEQVGIKVTGTGYRIGHQKSIFSEVRAQDNLINDIKQLEFRLGGPQVFKIKEVEPWSRIPERRYALAPLSQ